MHINPDHFLQTETGRVVTHEANNEAWRRSYEAFHRALAQAQPNTEVYVLIGAQGAGKSTWARAQAAKNPTAIIFDAILVKRRERIPILAAAQACQVKTIAVWFPTPLDKCLARNAARPSDEIVPEEAVRRVFAAIEPPSVAEGFERVIVVDAL